jgi:hypothetical protein
VLSPEEAALRFKIAKCMSYTDDVQGALNMVYLHIRLPPRQSLPVSCMNLVARRRSVHPNVVHEYLVGKIAHDTRLEYVRVIIVVVSVSA